MPAREQIARDDGEIKGKLDTLLEFYEEDRKRLAAVERKVWYGSGAAAVLAVIEGLQREYREERYRPAPVLVRAARGTQPLGG